MSYRLCHSADAATLHRKKLWTSPLCTPDSTNLHCRLCHSATLPRLSHSAQTQSLCTVDRVILHYRALPICNVNNGGLCRSALQTLPICNINNGGLCCSALQTLPICNVNNCGLCPSALQCTDSAALHFKLCHSALQTLPLCHSAQTLALLCPGSATLPDYATLQCRL